MDLFVIEKSSSPVIAAAIHEGHHIRPGLLPYMNLNEAERSREEDPYTGYLATISDNRVIVNISRFEVDMNRPREKAIYLKPEDAWGLNVWTAFPPPSFIDHSLKLYDAFYKEVDKLLQHTIRCCGYFAVLDIHSYNYKRERQQDENADLLNPEINIGTAHNDARWRPLIDHFITTLSATKINGHAPDVRENVKFMGGEFSRRISKEYGSYGCVLSVEFKKTFMDELTGIVSLPHLRQIKNALAATIEGLKEQLSLTSIS